MLSLSRPDLPIPIVELIQAATYDVGARSSHSHR